MKRKLTAEDYEAAAIHAKRWVSDPFAYRRACHALEWNYVLASDLIEGALV